MTEPRTCMFCDSPASTKEDAWPLWIVRRFPAPLAVTVEAERKGVSLSPWRQTGFFAKVRSVCASCNNGWMSRLETEAKPAIEKVLSNDELILTEPERELIARWVLKTAMVFEAVGGKGWFYSAAERKSVRDGKIPSGYSGIWVARCRGLSGAFADANNMFETSALSTAGVHGHVTTLAFGGVAFQVLTVRPSVAVPKNAVITIGEANVEPWPDTALQLWPPTVPFDWPPTIGLHGEPGVEAFSSRFKALSAPSRTG